MFPPLLPPSPAPPIPSPRSSFGSNSLKHPKMRFLATWNSLIVVVASAVPVTVGVTVETWLCGFFLAKDYGEE
ncbi:hypothetical protein F2Q69_00014098 [Brassica cretica]|uniref:Uncharacterized protein n=1 Tax=Brassica cretica TaxID=69181 RepID=A0A8S9QQ93_BRACR|nr:hypothetical protein F2Q69_00014098 [Brassica cretica]